MKLPVNLKALYGFFSRLSKREKAAVYITVAVVCLMVFDRLIIGPVYYKMQSLDEEINQKKTDIRTNLRIFAQRDRILSETAKYATFLNSLKYTEEDVTVILKEIESLANKSSVYLIDIKPGGLKTIEANKKYFVNLECEAQMEQLTDFMYNVENSNRMLRIEKFQISPKSTKSSIARCTISISKLVM